MTDEEALAHIRESINEVSPGAGDDVTAETDLAGDGVLDSLDLMNFLFELENRCGKIEAIDEDYNDYRVSALVDHLKAQ